MKFLRVFCFVVLYFQCGDFLNIQNNAPESRFQNPRPNQFSSQKYIGVPLNNAYNSVPDNRPNLNYFENSKPQEVIKFESPQTSQDYINLQQMKQINSQIINQQYNTELGNGNFKNLDVRKIHDVQRVQNNKTPGSMLQSQGSPTRYLPQVFNEQQQITNSPGISNVQSIKSKVSQIMPETDTKLELQGMSPEHIHAIMNKQYMGTNTLGIKPNLSALNTNKNAVNVQNRYIYNAPYKTDLNRANYDNPSAEVLYNMKIALPHALKYEPLSKTPQDDIQVGLKNLHSDIRKSEDISTTTSQMSTRYMVVHPDGRVEHVNEIDKIVQLYPSYRMINSQDFFKHFNSRLNIPNLQFSQPKQEVHILNNLQTPEIMMEHNKVTSPTADKDVSRILPTQSNESSKFFRVVPTVSSASIYKNVSPINYPSGGIEDSPILQTNKFKQQVNVITSTVSNISQQSNNVESELGGKHSSPIIASQGNPNNIPNNVILNNKNMHLHNIKQLSENRTLNTERSANRTVSVPTPLPYSQVSPTETPNRQLQANEQNTSLPQTPIIYEANKLLPKDKDIKNEASLETSQLDSNNKSYVTNNSFIQVENGYFTVSNTTKQKSSPALYISPEALQYINNIDLSRFHNVTQIENEEIATKETPYSAIVPTTAEAAIKNENRSLKSDHSELLVNATNVGSEAATESSSSTKMLPNIANSTDGSAGFWFLADDHFWGDILNNNNNAQNLFYFLFPPPKATVIERETKTIMYPNGTTVEEVSETRDEDGVPKVVRNTKVSYANISSTDV